MLHDSEDMKNVNIEIQGLLALTRLAFTFISYKDDILANGALEKAQEILVKIRYELVSKVSGSRLLQRSSSY